MSANSSQHSNNVPFQPRAVDRDLLEALRGGERACIQDLVDALGVTATAIRQRIDRLLEAGWIDREKLVTGRGRPTYSYGLTVLGHRQAGANYAELVEAMWQEILAIEDGELRRRLLAGIARRLGRQFRQQVVDRDHVIDREHTASGPLESQMRALADVLAQQRISTDVSPENQPDGLPVLDITSCPYPNLTDETEQRAMCHLEEEMFSEALGRPVHLTSCRLDGDHCCQFAPTDSAEASR